MNPSQIFILRPVATSLLTAGILLAGAVAYTQLPVSALPQVDYPTIQILTFYPGASPEVMASSVTTPLERQFGQLPGLSRMTSTSSSGASLVTLQFNLELNIDVAEQQVQAAINTAATFLPKDLPTPPVYSKVNPADSPVLTLAVTSDTLPLTRVQDLADTNLAQKISQLPGVGLVSISGGQKPAVRVQANPSVLASYGLSLEDVRAVLSQANVDQPKGNLEGARQSFTIGANDQLFSADEYRALVVAYRNGAPVRLSDVANVVEGAENVRQAAWMNDKPAVIVNIQRQPGANIIGVVNRIKRLLPQLKASLPASVDITILTDRTTTIRASVADVQFSLLLTVVLVVMVMFLFLRSLAATVIPSIAVPISLVGTFGIMYLLGYSLDNLSLMALTISTGFVVDDAIVMIENIARYIEAGESPLAAALKGSEQIGFTIVSLTVSLIAVLIPLLFMGEVVGRLFREFAITLSVTILVSAVVSLTLTPMMCAKILRHQEAAAQGWFYRATEQGFNASIAWYGKTLRWVLGHQPATLVITVATLVLTIVLYVVVPKGFFPVQDTGVILGVSEAPESISFTALSERQQALTRIILKDPDVASLSSFIGVDGVNMTPNSGRIQINLKPRDERSADAPTIIRRLQPQLEAVDGITLYMQPVQDLTDQYRVILEVAPRFQQDPESLKVIYVKSPTGAQVPLSAFTSVSRGLAPLAVNHQGQFPSVTLSFNLAPGVGLGHAVDAIKAAEREIGLPSSIRAAFQGTAQAFQPSLANQPLLILAALVTVYIVLGVLYESYIHPSPILSTLPSAGVGAILALLLCRTEFSVVALIGIILLIGIVKKNAIMMIDFALEAERKERKSPEESIYQASLLRFRPIMMTTMAALLGGLPLALGGGTGAELRRPLGISIVGGLLLSQVLTLFTTPVVYLYFDRLARRLGRFRIGNPVEMEAPGD